MYLSDEVLFSAFVSCVISAAISTCLAYIFKYTRQNKGDSHSKDALLNEYSDVTNKTNKNDDDYDEEYEQEEDDYDVKYNSEEEEEDGETARQSGKSGVNKEDVINVNVEMFSANAREKNKWAKKRQLLHGCMAWLAWTFIVAMVLAAWIVAWVLEIHIDNFNKTKEW